MITAEQVEELIAVVADDDADYAAVAANATAETYAAIAAAASKAGCADPRTTEKGRDFYDWFEREYLRQIGC